MKSRSLLGILIYLGVALPAEGATVGCGTFPVGGIGPWNYNDPEIRTPSSDAPQTRLKLVENSHFRLATEQLAYKDKNLLTGDIAYTLNIIPNHARALLALSRLELREGGKLPFHPNNNGGSAECYIMRAIEYQPKDGAVRMVYGMYLQARKRYPAAMEEYKRAEELGSSSAQFHYNYGLLLFEMKQYDAAYERARKAYDGGFPLPGLQKMLESVGKWP